MKEQISEVLRALIAEYGPPQTIAGLGNNFLLLSHGHDGGALVHKPCLGVVARFNEEADPEQIIRASEEHDCPLEGAGIVTG